MNALDAAEPLLAVTGFVVEDAAKPLEQIQWQNVQIGKRPIDFQSPCIGIQGTTRSVRKILKVKIERRNGSAAHCCSNQLDDLILVGNWGVGLPISVNAFRAFGEFRHYTGFVQ